MLFGRLPSSREGERIFIMYRRGTPEQRFWWIIQDAVLPLNKEECWEWPAARYKNGYGKLRAAVRGTLYTHRLSWELHNGPIPDGMNVCHTCDNPPCWNPTHLFLGTDLDNMIDRDRKGRGRRGKHYGPGIRGKLTASNVQHLRQQHEAGRSFVDIAKEVGINPSNVRRAFLRKTYMWVP